MLASIDNATCDALDISRVRLEADALRRIPRALALRHDILSLSAEGNDLLIAIPNAEDRDAIDRVRLVTGMHVRAVSASREDIRARLSDAYPKPHIAMQNAEGFRGDEAPAIRALDRVHAEALERSASDIHFEPTRSGGRVRQRVDGILYETAAFTAELYAQVISRVKLLGGMDIADRRQPQDGRYAIDIQARSVDARVSSMPTILGEKLVVRLLDHQAQVPTLEQLGMPKAYLRHFLAAVHAPHGFVVVCGPTGSGKTTTLYAAMSARNVPGQNLCSVEDPVEIRIPGVAQVQINPRAGVTFAAALRALLRQDPNVIMVGEMRDAETAAAAASAALSGQLLLTTLHANDAPRALDRLLELGVSRQTIAAGLTAIVAQRLVRRLCERCRTRAGEVYRAEGCERCDGGGYSGRTALFEMLVVDDAMRQSIAQGASSVELAEMARQRGYEPMSSCGVRAVAAGQTTYDELGRVLPVGRAS